MMQETKSHPGWIQGPFFDLFFFSPLWWVPACIWLFTYVGPFFGFGVFFLLYHLLLRLPHFVATFPVSYLRKENHAFYLRNYFLYLIVPAFILFVYGMYGDLNSPSLISVFLGLVSIFWGLQHISFQNYGILQIYNSRAGENPGKSKFVEKGLFFFLFLGTACLSVAGRNSAGNQEWEKWMRMPGYFFYACLAIMTLVYVAQMMRGKTRARWPKIIFVLVAVMSLVYWPIYGIVAGDMGSAFFFYMYNGQHCLSYIGLVYFMLEKRREALPPAEEKPRRILRFALLYTGLLFVSAVFIFFAKLGSQSLADRDLNTDSYRLFGSLEGFFVLHYYVESISWRFRVPHIRETTFSLLQPWRK